MSTSYKNKPNARILYDLTRYQLLLPVLFISIMLVQISCKKLVEVNPPITSITGARAYDNDGTAIAILTGLYATMNSDGAFTGGSSLSFYTGLSADELTLYNGVPSSDRKTYYYTNELHVVGLSSAGPDLWGPLYNYIYNCDSAVEGLSATTTLTTAVKKQLLGEALFLRAFCYFYLVNLYGDVPLVLGTDYKINSLLARTPKLQVWQQIIADLDSAQKLLSPDYLDGTLLNNTTERIRPTQGAATALLARTYLYTGNWQEAEKQATILINNTSLYNLDELNAVFLMNSAEAIWQLQPVFEGWNTEDAKAFIIPETGLDGYSNAVYLSNSLLNSFESGDNRKTNWIHSLTVDGNIYHYPYKYKSATYGEQVTEYQMMLRLGEQYLIRSEARAQQGNISGATSDLNTIRNRAGLSNSTASSKTDLLKAIMDERRTELCTESGQRWLDLKRTSSVDAVMQIETPVKANGSNWKSYQQLYPLPLLDIRENPNLTQNPGY